MTDLNSELNSENRELRSEELTIDELDSVSGGRMKIPDWVTHQPYINAPVQPVQPTPPGF
jgi:bacteriocin-like protein